MLLAAFYIKQQLFSDLCDQLRNQQLSTVTMAASQLDNAFSERLDVLKELAETLLPAVLNRSEVLQSVVDTARQKHHGFNNGIIVLRRDGTIVADTHDPAIRVGTIYAHKEAISKTLTESRQIVSVPRISLDQKEVLFEMAVPILNSDKSVAGAVVGLIDLKKTNFLDQVTNKRYGVSGGFLLVAPTERLLISGMNRSRLMEKMPEAGKNIGMDRVLRGDEETIIFKDITGIELLSSQVKIPSSGWILAAVLPTEEAFAPINRIWAHLCIGMFILTAFTLSLYWRILRRQFSELTSTIKTLDDMSANRIPRHVLPVKSNNEIGTLVSAFNRLLHAITVRESLLEKSEILTKSILNSVVSEIAVLNKVGTIIMVNQPWLAFFESHVDGQIGDKYGIGCNYLDICERSASINQNKDAAEVFTGIKAVLQGSLPSFSMEYACETPQGNKWFNLIATPLNHSDLGAVLSHTDVTERRQAQDALHLSEIRLRTLFLDVPGISIRGCREDGLIHYWNHSSEGLFGWSAHEVVGKQMTEVIVPINGLEKKENTNTLLYSENLVRPAGEFSVRRKDGRPLHIYSAQSVVNIPGQEPEFFYIDIDLTKKRQTEKALELTRIILDVASDAVFWITPESRITNANAAACQLLNYAKNELLQLRLQDICADATQCHNGWQQQYAYLKKHGSMKSEEEYLSRDGRVIPVEVVINYIHFEEAEMTCAFVRDISERKEIERELLKAIAVADNANRAKTNFLAVASHDLRQPISALSLYVDLIKPSIQPENREVINYIGECVSGLAELMTDLLDISKLDANAVVPRMSQFLIDDLLNRLKASHSVASEEKGVHIRLRKSALMVNTDYRLLQRIIGNLISNAVAYTDSGGILIACRQRQGNFWLEIWDTGIGIPEDQHEAIFEEFRQVSDEPRGNSSGLGLAIVLRMTRLLGLRIRLCSRPGKGSMFAVEMPVIK